MLAQLHGRDLGQMHDRSLGRGIDDGPAPRRNAGDAARIDDAAGLLLLHDGHRVFHTQKDTAHQYIHGHVEIIDRDFLDRVVTSVITTDPHHAGGWAEYAGGYSYLKSQQSGGGKTASDEASENSKRGKSAKRQKAKPKLSYKDQYALETLPGEIDALHKLITTHQATLADPALFSGDPDTFEATANALKAAEADLAAAEEKWLELEMAREDAGNG